VSDDPYRLYELAVEALEKGNEEEALGLFRRSLDLEPHFKTHHRIALILQRRGRSTEAGEHLVAAYSLNARNDRLACDYANWLITTGQAQRARKVVETILSRNKTYGPARALVAILAEEE
jgi:Flp pilus assembly protein TadD